MKLNLVEEKSSGQGGNKNRFTTEFLFFIALNVIAVPLSVWQTYLGYSKDVAESPIVAFAIAALTGILFAAMNFEIRRRILEGRSYILQLVFYSVPLLFSFFGNFNAFYSAMMRHQLYDHEIANYENVLTHTKTSAIRTLDSLSGIQEIEGTIRARLKSLKSEYDGDGGKQGWQTQCQYKWMDLRVFLESKDPLGSKMTDFNSGITESQKMVSAEKLSWEYFENAIKKNMELKYRSDKLFADTTAGNILNEIEQARKANTLNTDGKNLLDRLVRANNMIGENTRSKAAMFAYTQLVPSEQTEIGTIKHAINSAFVKWDSPSATLFALGISLVIDLAALVYIMVFIPFGGVAGKSRIASGPKPI
jgi:hypothetical protein